MVFSARQTVFVSFLVSISTFSLGLLGSTAYFDIFADSPKPPTVLGVSDEPTPRSLGEVGPTPIPTPNLALTPEKLDKPQLGTLAYLENNNLFTLKANRTSPDQITTDGKPKNNLIVRPNGLDFAYNQGSSIFMVNRQTKKTITLLELGSEKVSHLSFSPSGRFLSAWVNQGLESLILDVETKKVTLRFSSKDEKAGISPISWLPGSDQASFILDQELFTSDPNGNNLKTLALKVVAIKTGDKNREIPASPLWSPNGNYVSFLRADGLYLLSLDSREETAIEKSEEAFDLDKIPYQPFAFTATSTHLIYQSKPNDKDQILFAYSIPEKKTVVLETKGSQNLYNPGSNQLLGLIKDGAGNQKLTRYSLASWQDEACTDFFSYPDPHYPQLISSSGSALVGLNQSPSVTTLSVLDLNTCTGYDLVKSTQALSTPLWLPN